MATGTAKLCVGALVMLLLAACGRWVGVQREAWRTDAEERCLAARGVKPSQFVRPLSEMNGPGVCGMTRPFRVAAATEGQVVVKPQATLACPMISAFDRWLIEVVQPAAQTRLGVAVTEVKAGSYNCRPRNNVRGAKLSEHGFGNALDIMGFVLADGRTISVVRGWRGSVEEQAFLREVLANSCRLFTTVLGPGSNALHYDHFHLDLARHDAKGLRHYCRPRIEPPPPFSTPVQPPQTREGIPMASAPIAPAPRYPHPGGPYPVAGAPVGERAFAEDPFQRDLAGPAPRRPVPHAGQPHPGPGQPLQIAPGPSTEDLYDDVTGSID